MTPKHCHAYQQVEVGTADQGTLILLLYDGAIRFSRLAVQRIRERKYEEKGKLLVRAQEIVGELLSCLNMEAGEVAHSLRTIYCYMIRRLIYADVNRDIAAIEEVVSLLSELREAWAVVFHKDMEPVAAAGGHSSERIRRVV